MKINTHGLSLDLYCSEPDNEGWMSAHVKYSVPSFEGEFRFTIEIMEYKHLIEELEKLC